MSAVRPSSRALVSVTWVSERKDFLCGLFSLLSVITYTNYISRGLLYAMSGDTAHEALDYQSCSVFDFDQDYA